jgi:uncharacterized protein (TIGR03083 family)
MDELHSWIADERRTVADLVDSLTPEQLATRSLCAAWTVHDVAAHLLMPLVTSMPRVLMVMARNGFNFDRANVPLTAAVARRTSAQVAAGLREHAEKRFKPPGLGFEAPLTDLYVHGQDIRRPLGLPAAFAPERLRVCLDLMAGLRLAKPHPGSRQAGLRYQADDLDWSAGAGELVRGSGEAILLALNYRAAALPDLSGPGAALLPARWEKLNGK